jgi:hypothetical protein
VHCGSGSWGGQRPSLGGYVTGVGPMDRVTAARGRSCCLSSLPILYPPTYLYLLSLQTGGTVLSLNPECVP